MPDVDLDGVDQLLEEVAEPFGQRLLIADTGQRGDRLVVEAEDGGGIPAGLHGRAERADSINDIRQRLVVGYVWEIPGASSLKGAPRFILGGWQRPAVTQALYCALVISYLST